MSKMRVSREDLLKSTILPPGWYALNIEEYEEKEAKSDKSTNWNFKYTVIGSQNDKDKFNGVTLYRTFNEKGMGFAKTFFEALGVPVNEEGAELDPEFAVGKKIFGFVKTGEYNGRPKNEIEDFRPISA